MFNWLINYIFGYNDELGQASLPYRMKNLSKKWNSYCVHPFKPTIVTLKSYELLRFINTQSTYDEKILFYKSWNEIYKNVCEQLYNDFSPSMIYYFNDEIHLVFYFNEFGEIWGNGNVHKLITTITSSTTSYLCKQLYKNNIELNFSFNSKIVQFDDKYESLNWIIWRQLDCKKNIITSLYKCFSNLNVNNIKINAMENAMENTLQNENINELTLGTIMKKQKQVNLTENENNLYIRNEIQLFHIDLKSNFVNNFNMFIKQKYLD